jgi:hypothetical protein
MELLKFYIKLEILSGMKQWLMPTSIFLKYLMKNQAHKRSCFTYNIIRICKSVTSSLGIHSNNPKSSEICCHYREKNNQNTADCKAVGKFKQENIPCFQARYGTVKKSLVFLLKEINILKRQLKHERTAVRRGKR